MKIKLLALIFLSLFITSCIENQASDAPNEGAAAAPMSNSTTPLGLKVQDNGYDFDPGSLDNAFLETESCLGYADTPTDIYIILKRPYSAFPCVPFPNGCGGLFDIDNGEPVVTVTADFVRLKHEYIHYMLYYETRNPDDAHESPLFDQCG